MTDRAIFQIDQEEPQGEVLPWHILQRSAKPTLDLVVSVSSTIILET
jgi:hypothetical protein